VSARVAKEASEGGLVGTKRQLSFAHPKRKQAKVNPTNEDSDVEVEGVTLNWMYQALAKREHKKLGEEYLAGVAQQQIRFGENRANRRAPWKPHLHGQVQKDIAEGMEKKYRIQMDRQWAKYGYQGKTALKVVQTDGGMYEAAKRIHEDLLNLEQPTCNTCNRCWPGLPIHTRHTCSDCAKDKSDPKRFSRENVMDPGPMPEGVPLDVSPVDSTVVHEDS
jgi:hypothetical protein